MTSEQFLKIPLDAILFDCDNTLTHMEGIDELAICNGVGEKVKQLTEIAMGQTGLTTELYRQRLELTQPTHTQIHWIGKKYIHHLSEDAETVVKIFQRLKKSIYILSAGLRASVCVLGKYLNIPEACIFAVDIYFDEKGHYSHFDKNSILTTNEGKKMIVDQIQKQHARIGYVGDGLNDCSVQSSVCCFIGYGGAHYRENVAKRCQYYLTAPSFSALLPLLLTQTESRLLSKEEKKWYLKGLDLLMKENFTL